MKRKNNLSEKSLSKEKKNEGQSQTKEKTILLDNTLEANKPETTKTPMPFSYFTMTPFLQFLESTFQPLARQKNIKLDIFNRLAEKQLIFQTDISKFKAIVNNLLENAIQYSQLRGIINLHLEYDKGQLILKISDNSQGITFENLPYTSDKHYQLPPKSLSEINLDLDFSICQLYVKALNGTVAIKCKKDRGYIFTVKIPMKSHTLEYFSLPSIEKNSVELIPKTKSINIPENEFILVVEDNLDMCDYLQSILEKDYDLVFAHNGREALHILNRHHPPLLIITDLIMPIMDGMMMIELLRKDEHYAHIPVLVLTAKNNILDEIKATSLGVHYYLRKPFEDKNLKARIYFLLKAATKRNSVMQEMQADTFRALNSIYTNTKIITSLHKGISEADKHWIEEMETKIVPIITDVDLNIDRMCEILEISPTHLTRKMKAILSITPKKYIQELRLLLSIRMLKNKEYDSVKAVAFSVGFKSEKVFSRNFKARFGKYPSSYLPPYYQTSAVIE